MSDYYEPHALLSLSRSIVIAGQLGCGTGLIGRSLCARTGLRFVEVDRQIEHEAGRSLARIAAEDGLEALEAVTGRVLERLAAQRPWAVIVLDRAWPGPGSAGLLREQVDFVHVQRDPHYLFSRIPRELDWRHRWALSGLADEIGSAHDLSRLHALREPLLREAGIMLDAGSQHEQSVASILIETLDPRASAHRI